MIALGVLAVIGGLAVTLVLEHRPSVADRYGTRFQRDAAMFSVRILGAVIILIGAVLVIVARRLG